MSEEKTIVVFRKFKGEIIALFPFEMQGGGYCMSYAHIGQHSDAHYAHCVKRSTAASRKDREPLANELKGIGYNLEIRARKNGAALND